MKQNFIKTSHEETAQTLLKLGFQQIDKQGNIYTFLNTGKVQFSDNDIDKTKIQYSNNLCI